MKYLITVLVTFIVMQAVVVVMHELTHSTVAWLLGHKQIPFDIVWGNPLTLTGWDEGVHYKELFSSGHTTAAALIGVSPLIVHTGIVIMSIVMLQTERMKKRKWLFHLLYWFLIAHYMELIAYITMRAFAIHGDVGIFNRGLGLSPWVLFTSGSMAVAAGLYILFNKILPKMYDVFAQGDRLIQWMILVMTCFLLFIWGSGMRVMLYCYPDPQWMFGLLGIAASAVVLITCRPWQKTSRQMKAPHITVL
ncbi:MAG: hypothetical protein AB2L14_37915 [Candidatus Xenobiia bacterium LiM19]